MRSAPRHARNVCLDLEALPAPSPPAKVLIPQTLELPNPIKYWVYPRPIGATMAPSAIQQVLLSPAELSYLHTSLSLTPPIRPDGRTSSQFRPLIAETDILPGTNGSSRICFADGTEAIVGIKAEVEKSRPSYKQAVEGDGQDRETNDEKRGLNEWVEISVEIPGFRDDDSMPIFLGALLSEALLADGDFTSRLWINRRFHWKLYLDVSYTSSCLAAW
jgi:exosome complex component RRP42